MEDIKRILVVSEATGASRKAIHYGVSLARNYGAKLYVIHLVRNPLGLAGWNLPIPSLQTVAQEYERIREIAKKELDVIIDLEKARGLSVKELMAEGEPEEAIMKVAKEEHVDLLIMLAPRRKHLEHRLFGYNREEIVRKMPCSILMVKQEPESSTS